MMDDEFFWGVATSGYQSEGGYNGDGEPANNWALAERAGRVERTGRAAEFWTRYAEDFARVRAMGCNAFRLGIEWARVQPSAGTSPLSDPPDFDNAAIDGYADRLAACRAAGLEPIVTLQHFTHPAWLGIDAWLEDETVDAFGRYVQRVVGQINDRLVGVHGAEPLRYYVTLNEPNILVQNTYLAPGFPGVARGPGAGVGALARLLAAHVRAYNAVHDLYRDRGWAEPMVTTNTFCSDTYWSERVIYDVLSLRERGWEAGMPVEPRLAAGARALRGALEAAGLPPRSGFFSGLGRLFKRVIDAVAPRTFTTENLRPVLRELAASPRRRVFDYLGLDYYDPFAAHMFRPPTFHDLEAKTRSLHAWIMEGMTSKWWDWRLLPEGMHFFCGYYAQEYARPVLIAENGMALHRRVDNSAWFPRRDRVTRSEFLRRHVAVVQRLRAERVPMLGYMHWSLTDNYEWGSYTPRFGLFSLDYAAGTDRLAVDHHGDRPAETYAALIAAARDPQPVACATGVVG